MLNIRKKWDGNHRIDQNLAREDYPCAFEIGELCDPPENSASESETV